MLHLLVDSTGSLIFINSIVFSKKCLLLTKKKSIFAKKDKFNLITRTTMKANVKTLAALSGMALAAVVALNTSNAMRGSKRNSILKDMANQTTVRADSMGCIGSGFCGYSTNGTALSGKWREW